jgi:hypothetical protein
MAMPQPKPAAGHSVNPRALVEKPSSRDAGVAPEAIRAKPNAPFLLAHAPGDWEVVDIDGKPVWVPVLAEIPLRPGVCGVRTLSRYEQPEQAMRDLRKWCEAQGRIVIDPATHVEAKFAGPLGEGPVMRKIACRAKPNDATSTRYFQVFNDLVETPPGEDQVFQFDATLSAKWRAHLVESGVIRPPSSLVKSRASRDAQRRIGNVRSQPYPDAKLKAERIKAAEVRADSIAMANVPGEQAAA